MMIKRRRGSRKRGKRHRRNKRDDEKDERDLAKPARNWKRGTVDGESGSVDQGGSESKPRRGAALF